MKSNNVDTYKKVYAHYNNICFVCNKPATQIAPVIGNTKPNRKKYGADVIDSEFNMLPACSLQCNDLIDIGKCDITISEVVATIKSNYMGARQVIEELVTDNIARKRCKLK